MEFYAASTEMDIPFVRCPKKVGYQRRLVTMFATWRCEKAVPNVPEVALSCLGADRSRS